MNETLVGSQRWVVESPIAEIIAGAVSIPFLDRKVSGNLHPMSLSLKVPKLWRVAGAGVRVQWHGHTDQQCKQPNSDEYSCCSIRNQPPPTIRTITCSVSNLLSLPHFRKSAQIHSQCQFPKVKENSTQKKKKNHYQFLQLDNFYNFINIFFLSMNIHHCPNVCVKLAQSGVICLRWFRINNVKNYTENI